MTDTTYYSDIKFVDDHPSSTDEFRGQPHQRVADTLVSILENDEGGRAIGIEGAWGSGKSTVVDIAQSKLETKNADSDNGKKHTFFVFDAWAHQGDPLRRVFLQELIQCLDENDAVTKAYWDEQLEIIETSRRRVTESKAEKLSLVAKASLITVPLLPIAYGLMFKASSQFSVNIPFIGCLNIPYWTVGAAIVSVPFICAAFTWLSWRQGWGKQLNLLAPTWWRTKKGKKGKSVIWAFTRQTDEVTTEQLIREEEATTIEFNEIFDSLVADAAEHNHQVIIVFDNIDRLPSKLIEESWATMRNFFATTPGTVRQTTLKNVWLIVPFDRVHIETVFEKDIQGEAYDATPGFIEKTFEIVLRISPPILSNWRKFLEGKLDYSFGQKISETESFQIFKIFDLYNREHPNPITPRTIKAFVNTVVAQAKQWGKLIPIEHQAVYALYKGDISNNISKLQDSSILYKPLEKQLNNPNWAKSLAAAHFNVHPEEAMEILLIPEIQEAFKSKKASRLVELQGTSGFSELLHDYITQNALNWASNHPGDFFQVASTLTEVPFEDKVVEGEIWRSMLCQINLIVKAVELSEYTNSGLRGLLNHVPDADKVSAARSLVRAFSIPQDEPLSDPEQAGGLWYLHLTTIAEAMSEGKAASTFVNVFEEVSIQANIKYLFGIATVSSEKIPFSVFKPINDPDQIAAEFATRINAPSPDENLEALINAFFLIPSCVDWASVSNEFKARLQVPSPPLSASDAFRLLTLLGAISEKEEGAKEAISELDTDGSFYGILGIALKEEHKDLTSLALHELMTNKTGLLEGAATHPHYGALAEVNTFISEFQSSPMTDKALVASLADRASKDKRFTQVLRSGLPEDSNLEFYRSILREMVMQGTFKNLGIMDVLANTTRLAEILESELFKKFAKQFDDWSIGESITDDRWMDIDPQFLILTHPLKTKNCKKVINIIKLGSAALTNEQWAKSFADEDNAIHLIFKVLKLEGAWDLKGSFYDALKLYAQSLIEGSSPPIKFATEWHALMELLPNARLNQLSKWLRDQLIDKGAAPNILCNIFNSFGVNFSRAADFPSKSEDVIRVIIDPMLAEGSIESIAVIETNAGTFASTLKAATKEDRQSISDRLTQIYAAGDIEQKTRIETLARALKLKFEKSKLPAEDDDPDTPEAPAG